MDLTTPKNTFSKFFFLILCVTERSKTRSVLFIRLARFNYSLIPEWSTLFLERTFCFRRDHGLKQRLSTEHFPENMSNFDSRFQF